jgi:phosphoribosylglycinamide formyltransferase 1
VAEVAVLASGNGSNFESIVTALRPTSHAVSCLICDRKHATVFDRARRLGVPSYYVSYSRRHREDAEAEIVAILDDHRSDLIALAGFMRILSARFIDRCTRKIVNIHPTLLPAHPGAHGLVESFDSGDTRLGITVHTVDHGIDTGPILRQESFERAEGASIEEIEHTIHEIEHRVYPEVIISLLDALREA